MALTIREQIAVALKASLAGLSGVTVARNPIVDFDEDELPAVGLFLGDQNSEDGPTSDITINRMVVAIAGHATGATGEAAESAANLLYRSALAVTIADHTLGGLAVNIRETGLTVIFNTGAEGEVPLAGFELSLEVEYWTATRDPTALAP